MHAAGQVAPIADKLPIGARDAIPPHISNRHGAGKLHPRPPSGGGRGIRKVAEHFAGNFAPDAVQAADLRKRAIGWDASQ